MSSVNNDPPEGAPEEVVTGLEECSDNQLREIIHYAQRLLSQHPPLTDSIDSRVGEELVRIEDHDTYKIVIVEHPNESSETSNQFAYRVTWEPTISEEGQYRWHYLGRVFNDT